MCIKNKLIKIKVDEKIWNRFYFLAQRDAIVERGNWIKQQDFSIKVLHPEEEGEVCISVWIALFTSNLGNKKWENKDR